MKIKVNVNIHNKKAGDIISETDRSYKDFTFWAKRKDTRMGVVICHFVEDDNNASPQTIPELKSSNDASTDQVSEITEKKHKCDQCDFQTDHIVALYGHKRKVHKDNIPDTTGEAVGQPQGGQAEGEISGQ